MKEERAERMSRATALGILARIAQKRKTTLDEVNALQMAVRCIAKRMFDWERHCKRRREEEAPGAHGVPPAKVAGEPPALPGEGRTATPLQNADGAAAAPVDAATMGERVRAVAARVRELAEKAVAEDVRMGPGALMLWMESFATRLDQAVGDDPTPWAPYTEPLRIVKLPKREKPLCKDAPPMTAGRPPAPPEAEDDKTTGGQEDKENLSTVQPFNLSTPAASEGGAE